MINGNLKTIKNVLLLLFILVLVSAFFTSFDNDPKYGILGFLTGAGIQGGFGTLENGSPNKTTLIVNHTAVAQFDDIPEYWLEKAKNLTIHYAHTSHGSQLTSGTGWIESNINSTLYSFAVRVATTEGLPPEEDPPALRMYDGNPPETYIAPEDYWDNETAANALNRTMEVAKTGNYNFSMWSWCGQQAANSISTVQRYLDNLKYLEDQYPKMRFILMTGHLGSQNNEYVYSNATRDILKRNNDMVRNFSKENNMVLYDFADIEAYVNGTGDMCTTNDYHDYYKGYALECEWPSGGPSCAHTVGYNCIQKGKAFWWMMARLAGWNGLGTNGTLIDSENITTYVVPTMTDERILPNSEMSLEHMSNNISIYAAPGEFEPASFVIASDIDIENLEIKASDLESSNDTINASNVDIYVVKVWYQNGIGTKTTLYDKDFKVLAPELLLKDDSLIKVEDGENYIRFTNGTYKWISEISTSSTLSAYITGFPVKDNDTLQPVNITEDTNKQFWIVFHVPKGTESGGYTGVINLTNSSQTIEQISLELEVLPINLSDTGMIDGFYTYMQFNPSYPNGAISPYSKSEEQYRAELQNMIDHGVTNYVMYQNYQLGLTALDQALSVREEEGFTNRPLYYSGLVYVLSNAIENKKSIPDFISEDIPKFQSVLDLSQNYSITDVYFYGLDEVVGAELISEIPYWDEIHNIGGKILVACNKDAIDLVGDKLDLAVRSGYPTREEAALWHSENHNVTSYGNPQTGEEDPYIYRKNYGLFLWQEDYDGTLDWAYQGASEHIWNDFDDDRRRDEVVTYPTLNGVIDTIHFEGWREGFDDVRYIKTLVKKIEEVNGSIDTTSAEDWVDYVKNVNLNYYDLDYIRLKTKDFILYLSGIGTEPGWCGDGVADSDEECDSSDFNGENCLSRGYTGGNLYCNINCKIREFNCTPSSLDIYLNSPDNSTSSNYVYVNASITGDCEAITSSIDWEDSLVGYWSMDLYNNTHIFDSSGNNNHGILEYDNYTSVADVADTNSTQCVDDDTLVLNAKNSGYYKGWLFTATSGNASGMSTNISDYKLFNNSYRILYFETSLPGFSQGDSYKLYYDSKGPIISEGRFGKALEFDGFNDYVTIPDSSVLEGFDEFTVSIWVYTKGQKSDQGILRDDWGILRNSGASFYLTNSTGDGSGYIFQAAARRYKWHHIVATYDNNLQENNMKLYVDGILNSQNNFSGTLRSGGLSLRLSLMVGSSNLWNGKMDELRIWNRALSPEEIKAAYDSCKYDLYHNFTNLEEGNYSYSISTIDKSGSNETNNFNIEVGYTEFYVSPTGNDSNSGTSPSEPWQTIQHAMNTLEAGDTVHIMGGVYTGLNTPWSGASSGTENAWITYTNYQDDEVILQGTNGSAWNGILWFDNQNYIRITNITFRNAPAHGILFSNAGGSSSNLIIERCTFYNCSSSSLSVQGGENESNQIENVIVQNNTIYDCRGGWNPNGVSQEVLTLKNVDGFIIRNNLLYNNHQIGIDTKSGSRNGVVYDNWINVSSWSSEEVFGTSGIYVDAYDDNCLNISVFSNFVVGNGTGYTTSTEQGGTLTNIRVYNNIYAGIKNGYQINDHTSVNGSHLKNNSIFINNICGPETSICFQITDENTSFRNLTIRNNIISGSIGINVPRLDLDNHNVDHNLFNFSGYTNYYGTDYVEGDPLFVDPDNFNFSLQNGSPAIDTGSSLNAPDVDFKGNLRPQGNGFDIGAIESPYNATIINQSNQSEPFTLKWKTRYGNCTAWAPPVTQDIDGDGIHEIFIGCRNMSTGRSHFLSINGSNGNVIWNKEMTTLWSYHVPAAIADFDNDGDYEVVHVAGTRTIARNCEDGSIFWNVDEDSGWSVPAIADIDGTGYPYVFVASNTGFEGSPKVRKLYGTNGSLAASGSISYCCYGGISIADLDRDGYFEVVMSDSGDSKVFNAHDMSELWITPSYTSESHCAVLIDVVGDEDLEVVLLRQDMSDACVENATCDGGIHVYYANGSEVPGMNDGTLGLGCHVQPAVYDIDKDGNVEVLTNYAGTDTSVWDLVDWSEDAILEKGCEPPDIANVWENSDLEVVSPLAFVDGQVDIYDSSYDNVATIGGYGNPVYGMNTVTQDIDGDGLNEIIISGPGSGNMTVYDTLAVTPNPAPRTDTPYYSERRTNAAIYIPPPMGTSSQNTTEPNLTWKPPTLPNGTTISNNWSEINLSIIEENLDTFGLNWNGNNDSIYDSSLVLSMSFDNNSLIGESSDYFVDVSQYNDSGTCSDPECPSIINGKYGNALDFDGIDDYVTIPDHNRLDITDEITIEAWVKKQYLPSLGRIVGKGRTTAYTFRMDNTYGRIEFAFNNGSGAQQPGFSSIGVSDGIWSHVATTYDGSIIRYYINGNPAGTRSITGNIGTNDLDLLIGAENSGIPTYLFNGSIDEVRVYDRVLSEEEINMRYHSTLRKYSLNTWVFYSNMTGLIEGPHIYYGWANDTSGNLNLSEERTLNVDVPQSIIGSLDAGGFTGEFSEWNYSPYLQNPEGVTGSSNDSRIFWNGVTAIFNYSQPGDYNVRINFTPEFGDLMSGNATIRIIDKEDWDDQYPIFLWTERVREDARNGNNNMEKTVEAMEDLGANTISFFSSGQSRYTYLLNFLNKSQGTDIGIWAVLSSHCDDFYGSPCYPYGGNYSKWSEHFANLSLQYPQFKGWNIDDMHPESNPQFTPDYVRSFRDVSKRINPNFKFVPTFYFHTELDLFGNTSWNDVLDHTFMWYWNSFTGSPDLTELEDHLNESNDVIPPTLFVTGIYPMEEAEIPYEENFTKQMINMSVQNSDGIAIYNVHLWVHDLEYFHNATIFQQQTNDDPDFDYKLSNPGCYGSYIGWYQEIEQNISLPQNIDTANISFEARDSRGTSNTTGYHFKQLVVNDDIIWDQDIAEDGNTVETIFRDIEPYLPGDTATIKIRLYDKHSVSCFGVSLYVGNITIKINNETIENNWTFKSTIDNISRHIDNYNLIKEIFNPIEEQPQENAYYVANDGDDSNNGTINSPWQTIGKVNSEMDGGVINKGDDVYFKRGDDFSYAGRFYPRVGGNVSEPMIIGAYGTGPKPILSNTLAGSDGKTIQGTYMGGTGHYIFENLNISGCDDEGIHIADPPGVNNITIRNITLEDVGGYGVLLQYVDTFLIEDCEAIDIGASAFLAFGSSSGIHTRNGRFWNLDINHMGVDGIVFHFQGNEPSYVGSNHWIENCTINDTGEAGIDVSFGTNPAANLYVKNVEISHSNQMGIAAGHSTMYETYEELYIHDCADSFGLTRDRNAILRNSILEDHSSGNNGITINQDVSNYDAIDIAVYNNDIITSSTSDLVQVMRSTTGTTENLALKNNIFYSKSSSAPSRFINYVNTGDSPDLTDTNSEWAKNIFWRSDGLNGEHWFDGENGYLNWNEWLANPEVSDDLRTNPLFINALNSNFTLQNESPAIDAGEWLTATSGGGTGTEITVANANYFFDGYDIIGLNGDIIEVGSNDLVMITNINYTTNTITVNESITWSDGEPVSFPYQGNAPDIGAIESPYTAPIANQSETSYYVANDGNDSNNGTSPSSPWQTISKVNNALRYGPIQEGEDIYFKRGDSWNEGLEIRTAGDASTKNYMIIGAYGTGPRPHITRDGASDWGIDAEFIVVEYLKIQDFNITNSSNRAIRICTDNVGNGSNNVVISNIRSDGKILLRWIDKYLVEDCMCEGVAILGAEDYSNGEDDIRNGIVRNCVFGEPYTEGDTSGDGFQIHNGNSGYLWQGVAGPNHYILNCTGGGHSEQTYDITSGSHIYIKNCSSTNSGSSLVFGHHVTNVTLDNFYSYNSPGTGVLFSHPHNIIMRNSIIYNYSSRGTSIYGNPSGHTWPGNATNITIYNNNIISTGKAGADDLVRTLPYAYDIKIKNNILYSTASSAPGLFVDFDQGGNITDAQQYHAHNIYWRGDGATGNHWNDGISSYDIDGWNTLPEISNETVSDPELSDPTNGDYTLQSNSSAIDAGEWLTYTVGSGNGTIITVDEARYFFAGFTEIGPEEYELNISGDIIFVGDDANLEVIAIDYSNNQITINESITWNDGDSVSLPYQGNAPDIGAIESPYTANITLKSNGEDCSSGSECQSGYCVNGVCCNVSSCGICEACNVSGSEGECDNQPAGEDWNDECDSNLECHIGYCDGFGECDVYSDGEKGSCGPCMYCIDNDSNCEYIPAGEDTFDECTGLQCDSDASTPYYWGWESLTCYYRLDVSAANHNCDGAGSCRTAAQDCPSQVQDGSTGVTCDCVEGQTGCTGTTAGNCMDCNYSTGNIFYIDATLGNDSWEGNVSNGDFEPDGCEDDNDTSDCTNGPWRTTDKLNNELNNGVISDGDDIYLKRGELFNLSTTYISMRTTDGTENNPMIIGAYGTGDKPILTVSSSMQNPFFYFRNDETGNWIFENMHFIMPSGGHAKSGQFFAGNTGDKYNLTIRDCIFDGNNPGNNSLHGSILLYNTHNSLIENCIFTDTSYYLYGSGPGDVPNTNTMIKNCVIDGQGGTQDNMQIHCAGNDTTGNGPNHAVINVTSYNCTANAFDIVCGWDDPYKCQNVVIKDCVGHSTGGPIIVIGHGSSDVLVEDNYFENDGDVIYFTRSNNTIVRNNVFKSPQNILSQDDSQWDFGWGTENATIYHNTFIGGTGRFVSANAGHTGPENLDGFLFKNNIFYTDSNPTIFLLYHQNDHGSEHFNLENTRSFYSHNMWWRADGDFSSHDLWEPDYGTCFYNFTEWLAQPEVEDELTGDPDLINSSGGSYFDFQLNGSSPAIDAGDWLTETNGSGNGTTVNVYEANYFFEGIPTLDINGDIIVIGSNTVTVTDVNYNSETITVNESITWNDGDPVSLPYQGNAPDIGAFEYSNQTENNPPVILGQTPQNNSVNVSIYTSSLSVTLNDPDGDSIDWAITTSPDIGSNFGTSESSGIKTCSISNLTYNTTYIWYVNVSDGTELDTASFTFTTWEIEYANESDNETEEEPDDDSPSGGSSSGGGGGGGAGPSVEQDYSKTYIFSEVHPENGSDIKSEMKIDSKYIPISKVSVKSRRTVLRNIEVKVTALLEKPAEVPDASDKVYRYLSVESGHEEIKGWVNFKINKSWISANNINESAIRLLRYNRVWEKLITQRVGEDTDYISFLAGSPGFSYFAIAGEVLKATSEIPEADSDIEVIDTTELPSVFKDADTPFKMELIVLIIAIAILTSAVGLKVGLDKIGPIKKEKPKAKKVKQVKVTSMAELEPILENIEEAISSNNLEYAKELYLEARKIFENLPAEDRKIIYPELERIWENLKKK